MRNLILDRLEDLRIVNDNFNPNIFPWNGTNLDEVHFAGLSDDDLISVFESIIKLNEISKAELLHQLAKL